MGSKELILLLDECLLMLHVIQVAIAFDEKKQHHTCCSGDLLCL